MSVRDLPPRATEPDLRIRSGATDWAGTGRRLTDAVVASPWTVWGLIGLGILLRIGRYLHDRSLWLDEANIALNVMSRSYSDLFGALDWDQGAPVGFLVLEKLAVGAFGDSERVFRLFPLLAGIASVFVFWRVALRFLDRGTALLALAFFTVLEPFVYYSSETKPYSFDVLVALLLLWLFDRALVSGRLRDILAIAALGIVAPWLSHPSIFVLAGTGTTLIVVALLRGDRRFALATIGAACLWIASFAVEYVTSIRHLHHLASIVLGESGDSASALGGLRSVVKDIYVLFSEPGAMPRTTIGLTVFLVGVGVLVLARRSWPRAAALLLTVCAGALAALNHRYPLSGRWALFVLPLALLPFALGCTALIRMTRGAAQAVVIALVAILFVIPAASSAKNAVRLPVRQAGGPSGLQPMEQMLADLATRWRSGDTLYVSVKSQYAFRYYLTCHDCNPHQAVERRLWPFRAIHGPTQTSPSFVPAKRSLVIGSPRDRLGSYVSDMEKLQGRGRVWLLFSAVDPSNLEAAQVLLQQEGRQLGAIQQGVATLLLYDLPRRTQAQAQP
jgi:dolichyl-phosphate-mannose-protein mannosyltransferase